MSKRNRPVFALLAVLALAGVACGKTASTRDPGAGAGSTEEKAVQKTVRASLDAENDKDVDAFLALWTDEGLKEYDAGSREDLKAGKVEDFGSDKIELLGFADTKVSGSTATVVADGSPEKFQVARVKYRVTFKLIKKSDAWLLNGFEFMGSPPPAAGADKIDVKAQEYAFILDKDTTKGETAWKFTNTGKEQHELTLYKTPDGVDLETARKAVENVDGSELKDIPDGYKVDHVSFAEVGQSVDITFAKPLAAGTYLFACYIPQGGFGENGPANPNGKPHIKLGMAALLTVN